MWASTPLLHHTLFLLRLPLGSPEGHPAAEDPRQHIGELPGDLLRQLPRLLGQEGISLGAQNRLGSIIRLLVELGPQHKQLMLLELQSQLTQ